MAGAYLEHVFREKDESAPPPCFSYVLPAVIAMLEGIPQGGRVLDIGCGTGYIVNALATRGYEAMGIDLSQSGLSIARKLYPSLTFIEAGADANVLATIKQPAFDAVVSTEVVEHLYDPRSYAKGCFAALKPGGRLVISTPYHGYLKNVAIAVMGKWDAHHSPMWDCGHIKFWSRATLTDLLAETGFQDFAFRGVGRFPYLWKSMVMSARKPG